MKTRCLAEKLDALLILGFSTVGIGSPLRGKGYSVFGL